MTDNRLTEVLQYLLFNSTIPEGFDENKLKIASTSLFKKRIYGIIKTWSDVSDYLGDSFYEIFNQYALNESIPIEGGSLADGRAFIEYLKQTQTLPNNILLHSFLIDLQYKNSEGLIPRKRYNIVIKSLKTSDHFVIGLYIPFLRTKIIKLPFLKHKKV